MFSKELNRPLHGEVKALREVVIVAGRVEIDRAATIHAYIMGYDGTPR